MKKLLSILAAVGLTATASTAVVSCATKTENLIETVNGDDGRVSFITKEKIKIDKGTLLSPSEDGMTNDDPSKISWKYFNVNSSDANLAILESAKGHEIKKGVLKNNYYDDLIYSCAISSSQLDLKNSLSKDFHLLKDEKFYLKITFSAGFLPTYRAGVKDFKFVKIESATTSKDDVDELKIKDIIEDIRVKVPSHKAKNINAAYEKSNNCLEIDGDGLMDFVTADDISLSWAYHPNTPISIASLKVDSNEPFILYVTFDSEKPANNSDYLNIRISKSIEYRNEIEWNWNNTNQ